MGELIDNFRAALQEKIENNQLDGRADQEGSAGQARDLRSAHRPPGQIYRLFSSLKVDRADLFGNVCGPNEFDWNLLLERMKKPVDRTLWGMTPQTNNAYYDPTQNQITFPAGILQPPYFDPDADPAVNLRQHRRDHRP